MIVNIENAIQSIELLYKQTFEYRNKKLIMDPFLEDFKYSLCWSSNAIEGNTLSLDDTISFLEFDEVHSGHSFSEYEEAKLLNNAINKTLSFFPQKMDEEWIKSINSEIIGSINGYRKEDVYIGTQIEAVYYPPSWDKVPQLMTKFVTNINDTFHDLNEIIEFVAQKHIEFERIHPFSDGNGRTGRIILNQQLINNGLLPITIEPKSKYRQAFKIYNKNQDDTLMKYIICKGQEKTLNKILELGKKYDNTFNEEMPLFEPKPIFNDKEKEICIDQLDK